MSDCEHDRPEDEVTPEERETIERLTEAKTSFTGPPMVTGAEFARELGLDPHATDVWLMELARFMKSTFEEADGDPSDDAALATAAAFGMQLGAALMKRHMNDNPNPFT